MKPSLGRRIAMARVGAGMTMQALADALSRAKSTISHWENDLAEPSLEDISRISSTLYVNQNWLAFGEGLVHSAPAQPIRPASTEALEVQSV